MDLYADQYRKQGVPVMGDVRQGDWLSTTPCRLGLAEGLQGPKGPGPRQGLRHSTHSTTQLAIGFNPPFGPQYRLLHQFTEHCDSAVCADGSLWLVPQYYQFTSQQQAWYDLVLKQPLTGHVFYRPLSGVERGGVLCEFRVYRRRSTPIAICS